MKWFGIFCSLILMGLVIVITFSCDDDDTGSRSISEFRAILGEWRLQGRSINGVSDLLIPTERLTLTEDAVPNDLKGILVADPALGGASPKPFTLNPPAGTFSFTRINGVIEVWQYDLMGDQLQFEYNENGAVFNENWIRQ